MRLFNEVRAEKRYRVEFFNSDHGVDLRLRYHAHPQRRMELRKHHALRGSGSGRRRSKFKCNTCGVHHCIIIQHNKHNSCWAKWHESKRLEPDRAKKSEYSYCKCSSIPILSRKHSRRGVESHTDHDCAEKLPSN